MRDLSRRDLRPEQMDDPTLDARAHAEALRALAHINRLSHAGGILWPTLAELARGNAGQPLRVLDVATGGGDIPLALWHKARRTGLALELAGCDRSETALSVARQRTSRTGIAFFSADVLTGELPRGYDVVMSSLFLHHLTETEACDLLARMSRAANRAILVNDLNRSWAAYALAWSVSRLLSRSPVVHFDAPQSVAAAFTPAELRQLADRAGLHGITIRTCFPYRWLLRWNRE